MALRAKWTVKIEKLPTWLADGQPLLVSLAVSGLYGAAPTAAADCLDPESICQWILKEWPHLPPQALLQARVNELLAHLFNRDRQVQDVWVGVYRTGAPGSGELVGVERHATRRQFEDLHRALARPTPDLAPATKHRPDRAVHGARLKLGQRE
ncbi:hypothetical protein [Azohydromonas caseinilytica]|uniref:Uncharacterized protein n=1 Tax=Azohydromonas caseinilytica TaxID=2728836 RepID=A0A848FIN1_9BURK|nr:hypothetical protein [Azohydromonas caseinilytica]NML18093.1 hypothetical protein [Azohydromonas caseinilytica]